MTFSRRGTARALILAICLAAIATSCAPEGDRQPRDRTAIAPGSDPRDVQIAALQKEVARLKAELAKTVPAASAPAAEPMADISSADQANLDRVEREALRQARMCYKDYCPCEPPQGGPDQVLCDQLEEGIEVDVQLMIAGRGMREARRQIEEFDY